MNKALLIKYVKGEAAKSEVEEVLSWASEDLKNAEYLAKLQNIWVFTNMPQTEASEEELRDINRVIRGRSRRSYNKRVLSWAAAASVAIAMGIGGWYMGRSSGIDTQSLTDTDKMVAEQVIHRNISPSKELYTNKGVKAKIILPDSSVVILNSDTRINYPDKFDDKLRVVNLSGEAYFDVAKDSLRPMVVHTKKGFSIKVLGTKFNLKAYENDDKSQTTLYSGKIDLIRSAGNKLVSTEVAPFQTVVVSDVSKSNPVTKIMKPSPLDDKAWTEGKIIFDETPVSEVVKILERWHGYDFLVKDPSILDYKITATFNSESLVQVMDLIQMTSLVRFEIKNKTVFLYKK